MISFHILLGVWLLIPEIDLNLLLKEAVGDTLEELWISYNHIEKLEGIDVCKKLKVYVKELDFKK